jgi:hypothetical protein
MRIFRNSFHDGFLERALDVEHGVLHRLTAQVRNLKWAFTIKDLRLGASLDSHLIPVIHYTIETNPSALIFYITSIIVF